MHQHITGDSGPKMIAEPLPIALVWMRWAVMLMRVLLLVGYPCMKWACLASSSDNAISLGFESEKKGKRNEERDGS